MTRRLVANGLRLPWPHPALKGNDERDVLVLGESAVAMMEQRDMAPHLVILGFRPRIHVDARVVASNHRSARDR